MVYVIRMGGNRKAKPILVKGMHQAFLRFFVYSCIRALLNYCTSTSTNQKHMFDILFFEIGLVGKKSFTN